VMGVLLAVAGRTTPGFRVAREPSG